ncbi:tetratricopeptide repeat protein [Wenjunlia tyrosinilytica]|nr:tetratricopeptide repeat protein [Wenjunlia tyrosinilytica]
MDDFERDDHGASAPRLPRYNRSMANYARALLRPEE